MLRPGTPAPAGLRHEAFVARPLTVGLAALDHEAYVASPDVIRAHSAGRWPVKGFTVEQDRALAADHEAAHAAGLSFAFLLLDPAEREALGCLYVNPLHEYLGRVGADRWARGSFPPTTGMVTFWIRQQRHGSGLAEVVAGSVRRWLDEDWPLDAYVFRVRPAEHESVSALEAVGLEPVALDLPPGPAYRWFRPPAAPEGRRTGDSD